MAYMRDARGRRLDDFPVSPIRPATVVLFGDSRTADCHYSTATAQNSTNMDWFGWGNSARSGGPVLDVLANAGVAGNTTTQMLARIQSDAIDLAPGYLTLWGGTNDSWGSISDVAASAGRMEDMVDLALEAGIYVFLISETVANSKGTTFPKHVAHYNDLLRAVAEDRPGVEFWDFNSLVVDPTSAFGYNRSTMLRDGVHLGPFGASTLGRRVVAPALERIQGDLASLVASQADSRAVNDDAKNVVSNGLMQGSTGVPGAGHTGTLPDYWTSSGNVAALSVTSRADGVGNDITFDLAATSTNSAFLIRNLNTAHIVAGQYATIEASLGIDEAVDIASASLTALLTIGGTSYRFGIGYPTQATAAGDSLATGEYVLRSRPFLIPAGSVTGAEVQFRLGVSAATATATVRLGRVSMRLHTA